MSLFPAMIKLEGRKCVVVGAGRIAAAKATALLEHGAKVVVVSPQAVKRIQALARAGRVVWKRRNFAPREVADALLVVAATDSSLVNQSVYRACEARRILCNVVDDPEHCHFYYPAVVRRGPLQIAVSTDGRSPALAARLRRELEQLFGPEWGAWVEHIGGVRRELLQQPTPSKRHKDELLRISSPQAFRDFLRERKHRTSARFPDSGKVGVRKKRTDTRSRKHPLAE
jgi:precorrin-2 dehydrogenase/sirohydrochlorin ferrochelatase